MRKFKVTVNGQTFEVEAEEIRPGGQTVRPIAASPASGGYPAPPGVPAVAAPPPPKPTTPAPGGHPAAAKPAAPAGAVTAPMPGVINSLKVKEGDEVQAGDVLLILEAMKMENEITAPAAGKVRQVNVKTGQSVNAGETLVVVG